MVSDNAGIIVRRSLSDEKIMHLTFFLMCTVSLIASVFISTDGSVSALNVFGFNLPLRGICFFRFLTGYKCPVCGMTRCFVFISHGNIAAAWHYSHAGVPLYFFCIYESIYRLSRLIFGRFTFYNVLKAVEIVFLIIICAAVMFFFLIQFIFPVFAM